MNEIDPDTTLAALVTDRPEMAAVNALVNELRADLEPHMLDEELTLFPMVRALAAAIGTPDGGQGSDVGSMTEAIGELVVEHEEVGELLVQLRGYTDGYRVPDDGCASYTALYAGLAELESDTHLHVHKENNLLFPAVLDAQGGHGDSFDVVGRDVR